MRIFIEDHNASPEQSVRQALDILLKAGIYSAEGGGIINDRALIIIDAAHLPEAIAALTQRACGPLLDMCRGRSRYIQEPGTLSV
jgi:hypothetical protein